MPLLKCIKRKTGFHRFDYGRDDGIRTHDLFVPNEARYQAVLHPAQPSHYSKPQIKME